MTGFRLHARAALLTGLSLLVGACRSAASSAQAPEVPWSPLPADLPQAWRDLCLYEGESAFVLASSEAAARQAHALAQTAFLVFVDELGRNPRRGLLIAGSKADRLLVEGPEELLEAVPRWNAAATGREAPPPGSRSTHGGSRGDAPPELTARLVACAIPVDEPELELPPALRGRIGYVVLLPTDDCLVATCAELIDLALEREGVSWIQLKLAQALVGHPADLMVRELRAVALVTLLDALSASERLDAGSADAVMARAVASGVLPERTRRHARRR